MGHEANGKKPEEPPSLQSVRRSLAEQPESWDEIIQAARALRWLLAPPELPRDDIITTGVLNLVNALERMAPCTSREKIGKSSETG